MSAGQSQVSSDSIEKTKQQIRGLVGEIAQLSKSDLPPEEFYAAFLQRVVQALAAVGGAMWILGEGRKPQIGYQIGLSEKLLDADSDEASKHYKLLDYIVASKTPQLVPPQSSAGDERMGGNPTRQLLVIHPMGHDDQIEGLIEIFQRPDTQPQTQRGYLQFLKQMCELAAEWFKNRKLRDLGDRHSLWAQADQFARAVHESLDVRETCYTIVNEGRRMLGCDRVTIATLKGGRCVVEAVSGQDTLDNRSNVVTLLGSLATRVVKSGEPLWYAGSTEDLPPQIEKAIEEYVDQSYTKSLAVIPLRKPQQVDNSASGAGGLPVEERSHTGKIVGALIIEQIESDIPRDILAPRLDLVYEHSARALSNAIDHNSLFLMPVWRAIGKSAWVVQARTLPKTVTIAAAVGLLILSLIVVPWPYRMSAKGALEPKTKSEIFAPISGDITEVKVDHGDAVAKDQPLVVMRNRELEIKAEDIIGQLNTARENVSGLRNQLSTGSAGVKLAESDRQKMLLELRRALAQVESYQKQMKLLRERQEQLTVKSPIAGRVITWDAKRLLQNRPVETGQVLLTVAAAESDYEIKLYMPERRAAKVTSERQKVKADNPQAELKVDYILMTEPGKTYYGQVSDVADATETHEEHGNVVPIRVQPDETITNGRPGATVTAKVHCGTAPLGWCLLHEAYEWLEANVFF
jgi:multidrug efflux pump subunit AcrA (membrane-fusion protein)